MKRKLKRISHWDFFPRYKPGKASKVIHSFDELKPTDRVFLIERVSHRQRKSNLLDQDENLRGVVEPVGAEIVGFVAKATSGFHPLWLWYAVEEAKKLGATVLLAETTDRFIRHPSFHSVLRPDYQAEDEHLAELVEATQGMKLMTHLHPEASPSEVRSYQRKRGQRYKGNKGGQPSAGHKRRRRMRFKLPIIQLCKQGLSNREIARQLELPEKTVRTSEEAIP